MLSLCLALCCACGEDDESAPASGARGAEVSDPAPAANSATAAAPTAASPGRLKAQPLPERSPAAGSRRFERLPAERTGVSFRHSWTPDDAHAHHIDNAAAGGGVALGDSDGDGLPDLFLTRPSGGQSLQHNLGDFRFEDATVAAGLGAPDSWGTGPAFADVDGDGDLDLSVCVFDGPNLLYENLGDGTHRETAAALGLDFSGASIQMGFADYDLDGDLDAYLLTNRLTPRGDLAFRPVIEQGRLTVPAAQLELMGLMEVPGKGHRLIKVGQADHLYRNDGDHFTDVSRAAGISGNHYGLSVLWWDYDLDGSPDLYISNDFWGPDMLYHNRGDGRFEDLTQEALPHTPWFSMGADSADLDNDGWPDLMASDMAGTTHERRLVAQGDMDAEGFFLTSAEPRQYMRNAVYLNTGTGHFSEAAYLLGLAASDWTWAVKLADLDQDGWVDAYVSNGMTRDWFHNDLRARAAAESEAGPADPFWQQQPLLAQRNMVFRNMGELRFEDVSRAWGLDHRGVSFGAALGDLDGDGDLDLVVNDFDAEVGLYRNLSHENHRVVLRLEGRGSNSHGVGARVEITTQSGVHTNTLALSGGFMGTDEPLLHVGLGAATTIERLALHWPSGHLQVFHDLSVDQRYTLVEPGGSAPHTSAAARPLPLLRPAPGLLAARHRERPSQEFAVQPLLPASLSGLGPGLACADVDGDGDDDLYLGGAAGQPGTLLVRTAPGEFRASPQPALAAHADREDMAPLFFDADGDGDQDLYVVSGSNELPSRAPQQIDRLYLNDGRGRFTPAPPGRLPELSDSGSVVAAADVDRDGDLDLFVGGRLVPGEHPSLPTSHLLLNQGGSFVEAEWAQAAGIRQAGLVTAAVWSDLDGDGWVDLAVAADWSPLRVWRNDHGVLVETTRAAGLSSRKGRFCGLAAADLDGDGDSDLVLTNLGLNTRYRASRTHPARLYYGDFEGTGERHILEAQFEGDVLYPLRDRSAIARAMPYLLQDFPTDAAFAAAPLLAMVPPEALATAQVLTSNTLESGVWLNDGSGRFAWRALPRLAQIAPAFGVLLTELDGDGHPDLVLAQNSFAPQPQTGRFDGGLGLVLLGRGDGSFTPLPPLRSGVVVTGQGRGLISSDLDGNGWPDLVFARNDAEPQVFLHGGPAPSPADGRDTAGLLRVVLKGRSGNPTAVGARVRLTLDDGTLQSAEVFAGSGYLSQTTATLTFGCPAGTRPTLLSVRWPDGAESDAPAAALVPGDLIVLAQP